MNDNKLDNLSMEIEKTENKIEDIEGSENKEDLEDFFKNRGF